VEGAAVSRSACSVGFASVGKSRNMKKPLAFGVPEINFILEF